MHSPVQGGAEEFTMSDRGRFERMWITFLYVLIEAWRSPIGSMAKCYMESKTDISEIDDIISKGNKDGSIKKMRNVRDYMSHRDKREYWDTGRIDVACQLEYHETLYSKFSRAFLEVFNQSKEH